MTDDPAEAGARILAEVIPRLGRMISAALESDPHVSLSLRQYRMLERLSERPHRTTELARSSGVTQPTASAAIASLKTRNLVARSPDPGDGRAGIIELTDAGRATLTAARQRVLERLMLVTSEMTPDEVHGLASAHDGLIRGADRARAMLQSTQGARRGRA